ncbi:MAG: O-antigen ligase family protein [Ruminococcus sp.]|nr:O-antigen ligase family protein [Ruminococcus sp.]
MKIISSVSSQIKVISKSKNPSDFFNNIPRKFADIIVFIPVFLFMFLPLYQLINDFLFPTFHSTSFSDSVSGINNFALVLGIVFLIIYIGKLFASKQLSSIKSIAKYNIHNLLFTALLVMMILSTLINGVTDYVVNGDSYRQESLLSFFLYFCFYYFCTSKINSKKLKTILFYTLIVAGLCVAVCEMINFLITPVLAFEYASGPSAIYQNSNHYAYFITVNIMLSSVLFIKEKKYILKALCIISFVINTIVLILNDTFGCYIACLFGLIFACIVLSITDKKFSKPAVFMLIIFILITVIMSLWFDTVLNNIITLIKDIFKISKKSENAGSAGTGRWKLWTYTMDYIKEKPVFGFGLEGMSGRLLTETNISDRPHNEFLQYSAFFGIPATVFYVAGILAIYLKALKNKYKLDIYAKASLITAFAYLVSSLFGNTMYYTTPYLFILLGIGTIQNSETENTCIKA